MSFLNHVGASFKQAAVRNYFSFKVLRGSRESLSGTRRKGCINYIAGTDIDEVERRKEGKRTRRALEKSMLYVVSKVFGLFTRVFFRFITIALCMFALFVFPVKNEKRIKSTTPFLILEFYVCPLAYNNEIFRKLYTERVIIDKEIINTIRCIYFI